MGTEGSLSNSTNDSQSVIKENKTVSQIRILRLRLLLLFYDEKNWYHEILSNKVLQDEENVPIIQCGQIFTNAEFIITEENGKQDENIDIITERLCIKEKLTGNKKKDRNLLKKFQKDVIMKITEHYNFLYNDFYLDILIPQDSDLGFITSIYQLFLFDKDFIGKCKKLINIKQSSISILYPQKDNENRENELNKTDAKIAALMSHYVYFYLDWLEYVHVHIHSIKNLLKHELEKYKEYKYKHDDVFEDIIDEFDILERRGLGILGWRKGMIACGGKEKVKFRIINRLREIAKVVNFSKDKLKKDDIIRDLNTLIEERKEVIVKCISGRGLLESFYLTIRVRNRLNEYMENIFDDETKKKNVPNVQDTFNKKIDDIKTTCQETVEEVQDILNKRIDDIIEAEYKNGTYKDYYKTQTETYINEVVVPKVFEAYKDKDDINKHKPFLEALMRKLLNRKIVEYEENFFKKNIILTALLGIIKLLSRGAYIELNVILNLVKNIQKELDNNIINNSAINPKIRNNIKEILSQLESIPKGVENFTQDSINKIETLIKDTESLVKEDVEDSRKKNEINFEKFLDEICALPVYINILSASKSDGRPVGFYDLYERFGYWNYINDGVLTTEAQNWYVSHPYIVYKNDYEQEYKTQSTNNDDKAYDIKGGIPRKTQNIFICKQRGEQLLVYNTVLTHGMDQLSGYGGLLFTKVELDSPTQTYEAKKYAYCTKGTDANSINDWLLVDILQGVSGFSLQHLHNVKNAITINKKVGEGKPLFFCGHSLGGGLASAGAIACKKRHAITFNAAGLNFLGVLATRTAGGFNYGFNVPKLVHPIRIDGEAIDFIMIIAKYLLTAGLNERAYGAAPLILKLSEGNLYDLTWELGAKHGINNFLYKPLMDALDIVDKKTIKVPVSKENYTSTSIATLGIDNVTFQEKKKDNQEKKKDNSVIQSGNYIIEFTDIKMGMVKYVSAAKFSLEMCLQNSSRLEDSVCAFLNHNLFWESPRT